MPAVPSFFVGLAWSPRFGTRGDDTVARDPPGDGPARTLPSLVRPPPGKTPAYGPAASCLGTS